MAAFAPQWPEPREERWFFFVADPGTNEVISPVEHVSLVEAEFLSADAAQVICATSSLSCAQLFPHHQCSSRQTIVPVHSSSASSSCPHGPPTGAAQALKRAREGGSTTSTGNAGAQQQNPKAAAAGSEVGCRDAELIRKGPL